MTSSWDNIGEIANVAQLTGLDAVRLTAMIVKAASTARMHKKNCRHFAQHLKLIGNLLEQLKISELKKYPETREPLEQLEDALRRSYILVNSCQDRSYFYLLAMGWNIVYQFKKAQSEIDKYLKLVPLITLVDHARVREKLEVIQGDHREYTLDEEDRKVQELILRSETTKKDKSVLKKTLSRSYPDLPFDEALQKEHEKLHLEMQRSQANRDASQCEMIQHLLDVTENASNFVSDKDFCSKDTKKVEYATEKNVAFESNKFREDDIYLTSRNTKQLPGHEEWHADLLDCCSEPGLCMKTFVCPCATFSRIATVATNRHISTGDACNELMAYTLVLSCCCYTCCIRRKLRKMFNIAGGIFDDFLSHFLCCCCALVQEWREVEIQQAYSGNAKTKISPPTSQYMET